MKLSSVKTFSLSLQWRKFLSKYLNHWSCITLKTIGIHREAPDLCTCFESAGRKLLFGAGKTLTIFDIKKWNSARMNGFEKAVFGPQLPCPIFPNPRHQGFDVTFQELSNAATISSWFDFKTGEVAYILSWFQYGGTNPRWYEKLFRGFQRDLFECALSIISLEEEDLRPLKEILLEGRWMSRMDRKASGSIRPPCSLRIFT